MSVEIDVDDSAVEQFISGFAGELDDLITVEMGEVMDGAVEVAKSVAPVRTGFLRSTIFWERVGDEWHLIAGASYAVYQEFGTRWVRAKMFLTLAWEYAEYAFSALADKIGEFLG